MQNTAPRFGWYRMMDDDSDFDSDGDTDLDEEVDE